MAIDVPGWTLVLLVSVFAAAAIVHAWHLLATPGLARIWHCCHLVMAAGMALMAWPQALRPDVLTAGALLFVVLAAGCAGLGLGSLLDPPVAWVWWVTVAELLIMAYMFAMMSVSRPWLTALLAIWSLADALSWVLLRGEQFFSGLGIHSGPEVARSAASSGSPAELSRPVTSESGSAVFTAQPARPGNSQRRPLHEMSTRLSVAAMNGGMALMLLAMQFAPGGMAGGGHHMHHL